MISSWTMISVILRQDRSTYFLIFSKIFSDDFLYRQILQGKAPGCWPRYYFSKTVDYRYGTHKGDPCTPISLNLGSYRGSGKRITSRLWVGREEMGEEFERMKEEASSGKDSRQTWKKQIGVFHKSAVFWSVAPLLSCEKELIP
jgi:hypothetical protein